jgi:hypothetical protein
MLSVVFLQIANNLSYHPRRGIQGGIEKARDSADMYRCSLMHVAHLHVSLANGKE